MIGPKMNADESWVHDLEFVSNYYGSVVSPRGMEVYESIAYRSLIDMNDPIIYNEKRGLGYRFMAAEAAWILEGRDDVKSIAPYSKEISKFSDNGETFFGAYGPPINQQIDYVIRTLANDRDSRQAALTIWRQNPAPTKDVPCTVALQWLIRDNKLHCVATMRSSDLWLGHPYDIFNFSAVSFGIMIALNQSLSSRGKWPVSLGNLFLNAGSKHIYSRNIEAVREIIEAGPPKKRPGKSPFDASQYEDCFEFIGHLWDAARGPDGALSLTE
jgi:thymidylate synthase